MRILHVMETVRGGTGSYLNTLVPLQIRALGLDNVACVVPSNQINDLPDVPEVCMRTLRAGRTPPNLIRSLFQILKYVQAYQPDIIHAHSSFSGLLVRLPYLVRSRDRPRIIYCAHGWSFTMEEPEWKRSLYRFLERILAKQTDIVVNISDSELREAIAAGIPRKKCVRIYNGVRDTQVVLQGQPFAADALNLLFVGRFDRQKGLDLALSALRNVDRSDLRLHLIGAPFRQDAFHEFDLPPTVNVLGWMPQSELDNFYRAADAVIVPSRWEGFGLVAAEALRNGTPVICSDRGALKEIIVEGVCGYVFSLDEPRALINILNSLNRQELTKMRDAARLRYEQQFTDDFMHDQLVDLYRDVLAVPPTSSTRTTPKQSIAMKVRKLQMCPRPKRSKDNT